MPNGFFQGVGLPGMLDERPSTARSVIDAYAADPNTHIPQGLSKRQQIARALMDAGQAVGAISGRGWDSPTIGQVISTGLGGYMRSREEQTRKGQYQALLEQHGPAALPHIMQHALVVGDHETAKQAAYAIQTLNQNRGRGGLTQVAPGGVMVDAQGNEVYRNPRAAAGGTVNWQRGTGENPQTGKLEIYEYNPRTREINWLGIEAKPEDIAGQRETYINAISDDFRARVKDAGVQDIAGFYATGKHGASMDSAYGDVLIIQSLAKVMDPGSVVREGELRIWAERAGMSQAVIKAAKRLDEGVMLTPGQRKELAAVLDKIYEQRQAQFAPVLEQTRRRAEQVGIDPDMVMYDPFEFATGEAEPKAGAPSAGNPLGHYGYSRGEE